MKKYYSDKEKKERLEKLTVIVDTREQVNHNITSYLSQKKVPYINRKLDVGDYSFMVDDITFEKDVVIERKANIDEIAGNVTNDRKRFENEFLRAKANEIKVFLIIENCSWQDITAHNYKSKLNPKALKATLLSWMNKYDITIIFCKPNETGEILYGTLYYWLKNSME